MPVHSITSALSRKASLAIVAAALGVTAFSPASAHALQQGTVRYAAPSGISSGTCDSSSQPCSLQHAFADAAQQGDRVSVAGGTYTVGSRLDMPANDVTVEGAPGARPVLDFPATLSHSRAFYATHSGLVLRHLTIRVHGTYMDAVNGSASLEDTEVHVTGDQSRGLVADPGAAPVSVSNSSITAFNGIGVQTGVEATLRHTSIWSGGIALEGKVTAADPIAVVIAHDSILHGETGDVYLRSGGTISHTVALNIDHSAFRPNKVLKDDQYGYLNDKGGNTAATPKLVDPASGDLHQLFGSPTIDSGSTEAGDGTTDIDGQARAQGSSPDMGADEFAPAVLDDPPAAPGSQTPAATGTPAKDAAVASGAAGPISKAAPSLTYLSLKPATFRVARGKAKATGGTRVGYLDSKAATTRFTVQRRTVTRRHGKRQLRWTTIRGSLTHRDHAGANGFAFTGKVGGRALAPGRYRVVVVARDASGQAGTARRAAFRITG